MEHVFTAEGIQARRDHLNSTPDDPFWSTPGGQLLRQFGEELASAICTTEYVFIPTREGADLTYEQFEQQVGRR